MKNVFQYTDEKFADLQLLHYKVEGFEELTLKQKKLIYYLSEAALYGRDILFDQNGKYNLRIRKMLEAIYTLNGIDRKTDDFQPGGKGHDDGKNAAGAGVSSHPGNAGGRGTDRARRGEMPRADPF